MEVWRAKAKVVVVGDAGVGKRSLVRRSAFDPIDDRWFRTLGAKVSKKEILLPVRLRDGTYIDLILWTVEANALRGHRRAFASRASGIFAVCDVSRRETLAHMVDLVRIVHEVSGPIPVIVAANKWDLDRERQIEAAEVERLAGESASECFLTSAATGANVEAAFQSLGEHIVVARRAKSPAEAPQGPP